MLPRKVIEIRVAKALYKSKLPDLDYSLNPYQGCSFGCIYCYAMHFTGIEEAANNWGEVIAVKVNLVEVLKREIMHGVRKGVVGVSTITDPYMPVEARYSLTRRSIELLLAYRFRVSIQTKSPLVLRDLDILRSYRERVDVGMTITTMDPSLAGFIEPRAPHPLARARALKKISDSAIYTWIFLGPIIPGLNDGEEHIESVIEAARESNSLVIFDLFNIYDKTWSYMKDRLGKSEATRIYRVVMYRDNGYWSRIRNLVFKLCSKYHVMCIDFHWNDPLEIGSWTNIRRARYIAKTKNKEAQKHL